MINAPTLEVLNSNKFKEDLFALLGFDTMEDFIEAEKTMTMLFNPVSVNHWIYKRFFQDSKGKTIFEIDDGELNTPELFIMHSTHWDNQFLTMGDHRRYEQYRFINQYFYSVYAQGRWGVLGDLIFTNVKPARFNADFIRQIPEVYVGMDFGVTDPNAMVRTGINHEKREIYIIDESVESEINSRQINTMARKFLYYENEEINADCAGSQMIKDLRDDGFNVRTVVKYGKVKGQFKSHGIGVMWGYTIFVSVDCPIFMSEITEYTWKRDSNDQKTGEPNDGNDHCIDSGLFYALNKVLMKTKASRIY